MTSLDEADEMLRTVMSKDKVTRDELRTVLRSHGIKATAGLRGEAEKLARVSLVTEPVRPGRDWSQPRTPQKPRAWRTPALAGLSRESLRGAGTRHLAFNPGHAPVHSTVGV